jgi:hypothetical protein
MLRGHLWSALDAKLLPGLSGFLCRNYECHVRVRPLHARVRTAFRPSRSLANTSFNGEGRSIPLEHIHMD